LALLCPRSALLPPEITADLYDKVIADHGTGLAVAIHAGLITFPEPMRFINWLGDDDLLKSGSLVATVSVCN